MTTIYKMLLLLTLWFPFAETQGQQLQLALDSASGQQGNQVEVALRARNFSQVLSAQGTIGFDPQVVAFDTVTYYGLPGLNPSGFSTGLVGSGKLSFSWDDASLQGVSLPDDSALFVMRFSLTGAPGTESPLHFSSGPVPVECSDTSFSPLPLDTLPGLIRVEDTATVGLAPDELRKGMGVYPNPLEARSLLRVQMPQHDAMRLRLLDLNGREAGRAVLNVAAGETEIAFFSLFPQVSPGIYLLTGECPGMGILIQTMIVR